MLDRKFKFLAVNPSNGKIFTENEGVVFLAKDDLFPPVLLRYYHLVCDAKGKESDEAKSVWLMLDRVLAWRGDHQDQLKLPDITGEEERQRLLMPNESRPVDRGRPPNPPAFDPKNGAQRG